MLDLLVNIATFRSTSLSFNLEHRWHQLSALFLIEDISALLTQQYYRPPYSSMNRCEATGSVKNGRLSVSFHAWNAQIYFVSPKDLPLQSEMFLGHCCIVQRARKRNCWTITFFYY
jgi:hypothetical protein